MSHQLPNHIFQPCRTEYDLEPGEIRTGYSSFYIVPIIRQQAEPMARVSTQLACTQNADTTDDENPFVSTPRISAPVSEGDNDVSQTSCTASLRAEREPVTTSSPLPPSAAPQSASSLKRHRTAFIPPRKVEATSSVQLPLPRIRTPNHNRRIKILAISEIPKKKITGRSKKIDNILKDRQINVMSGKPPPSPKSHRKKAERSAHSKIDILRSPRKKELIGKRHLAFHGASPACPPIPFSLLRAT